MTIHVDAIFEFLVENLARVAHDEQLRRQNYGADLYVPLLLDRYWSRQGVDSNRQTDEQVGAFYDAVAELCRIGVLRMGYRNPSRNVASGGDIDRKFSLTAHGIRWVESAGDRQVIEIGRMAEVFAEFTRFGDGFDQRSSEAVGTYRHRNYLASCVMCGAAAEAILLAVGFAKLGEARALKLYLGRSGRSELQKAITPDAQFASALSIMGYWRDDAAHGRATEIGEINAWASLTQLLQLAQFSEKHWSRLVAQTHRE
ncbi:MAG TPA: hypothetical protein VMT08_30735 [Bradyrhizobium sp.]|nr:hypothetical protein [Bradyrhizobium sp.]